MTAQADSATDDWDLILRAAMAVQRASGALAEGCYTTDSTHELLAVAPGDSTARLHYSAADGWSALPHAGRGADLLDLYLPLCSAREGRPITLGHLGQSLDGFIATPSGDSNFVTGQANILHLHRLRALCDAVIVGAGTVSSDDPRLTTRLVRGSNPLRVIIDPHCRLAAAHGVFSDGQAPTLRACARGSSSTRQSASTPPANAPAEEILELDRCGESLDLAALLVELHARGCHRVFVEGGGVTVSSFLRAGLLDRLQIAVAPLLIGDGRPAIRIPGNDALDRCLRLRPRVFRMGADLLYDCDLRAAVALADEPVDLVPRRVL